MAFTNLREWFIRKRQLSNRQQLTSEELQRIADMFSALASGQPLARPSRYWEELNKMNLAQLSERGYENFKRTIALNYFTWVRILPWDSQIVFLCKSLSTKAIIRATWKALGTSTHRYFSGIDVIQSFSYGLLGSLLWEYILALPLDSALLSLREPHEGNPPLLFPRASMEVSQDLGNSLLEYDSLHSAIPASGTVLELGSGYGRNGFVILKMRQNIRYIFVDIPPALWIAERYISSNFPDKRIFHYRKFATFEEIANELERSDIAFLLSTQLEALPPNFVDLAINISSLHEMRKDQVTYYLQCFDKVLKAGGHLYLKQWKEAKVLFEGVTLVEGDYPIPSSWQKIFSRTARVQTRFFEALYKKGSEAVDKSDNAS